MSCTLPRLVGPQVAARLFYTGERIGGDQMLELGLADVLVPDGNVRARALALEIAQPAPLAVQSTRATLCFRLADAVQAPNACEWRTHRPQFASQDFLEGVAAAATRRLPVFTGH